MEIIGILGFCIGAAAVGKLLEGSSREIKLLAGAAACAIVFIKLIPPLNTVLAQIRGIMGGSGIDGENIVILFKSLGICYLTELVEDICKDSGENAIASQAELAGKIALMIVSLPLLTTVTELIKELLI